MRRITLKHAQPGMIVEMPVYDNWGELLVYSNNSLTKELIDNITRRGVSEIFVRDWRVMDVLVAFLFTPQSEGLLAKNFRQFVMQNAGKPALDATLLSQVQVGVSSVVRDMNLNVIGDVNVSCSISPKEYVYLQPVKTAGLALAIGTGLGLKADALLTLGMAAVLKDIGLTPEMINAVDFLTEGGSARLRNHPADAHKLLMQHQITAGDVATAVLHHHENWSGSGYPNKIKGKDISYYARIIAIADAFVDLLAERPGRKKCMPHDAIEYIMASGGDQFDPQLVETFVRQIPSYPAGLSVKLNTGDIGIVCNPKRGFVARPIVRICIKPDKGELEDPEDIDLSLKEFQRMLITQVLEYD
jgi:HD-GYP domain-containing protein (c-di-GMP phosphodiesterase class II)